MKKHPQKNKKPNTSEIIKASERIPTPAKAADGPEVVKAADRLRKGNQAQSTPDGIRSGTGKAADGIQKKNGGTMTGSRHNYRPTHQKPHRATKRPEPDKIHVRSQKRHHGRNYKAADKRRTKYRNQPEKLNFPKILCERSFWEANFSPPSKNFQASYRDTLGGIKKFCNIFRKNFSKIILF